MLLILDNFEHLLDGANIVTDILDAAPHVKLLVTSREALNLQAEHLWPLAGLDTPPDNALEVFDDYSAVQLFVERTWRVKPDFSPEAYRHEVVRICRLVDGLPLALELAAGWTRVLNPQAIGDEIQRSIDFLASNQRDVPERHRSMRAVFDRSWRLLSEEEHAVFRKLSVFRGGFTLEAAEQVAGASLPLLASLIDKSLLRLDASGRYDLHELVRQYAEERLDQIPDLRETVLDLHCDYYTDFLHQRTTSIALNNRTDVLAEMDNIRAAWRRAAEQRNLAALQRAASTLNWLYQLQSWHDEGVAVFQMAIEALRDVPTTDDNRLLLGMLLLFRCHHQSYFRQVEQIEADLDSALALWEGLEERPEMALPLAHGSIALLMANCEWEKVIQVAHKGLLIARRYHDRITAAESLVTLGRVFSSSGEIAQGRQYFEEAMAINRQIGFDFNASWCQVQLGVIAFGQGRYLEAKAHLEAAITHRRAADTRIASLSAQLFLGTVELELGDDAAAREHFAEEFAIACEMFPDDLAYHRCIYDLMQGITAAYQGDWLQAEAYLEQALSSGVTQEFRHDPTFHDAIGCLALLCGDYDEAFRNFEENAVFWSELRNLMAVMWSQGHAGHALLGVGQYEQAAQYLGEALQASLAMQAWSCTLEALTGLAQLPTVPAAVAVQVLVLTGSHPAANRFSRIEASRALAALKDKLVYETFQTAVKQGEALDLETAAQQLLAEIRPDDEAQTAAMPAPPHIRAVNQALPDPLTPRELEVLSLICSGLSNQQIADQLVVGVSTVKKHINGLYGKLAVVSRAQAILRAQELGLT
jgi:predicted ATPase/DNA-binding NarL/FixJ family response regulator